MSIWVDEENYCINAQTPWCHSTDCCLGSERGKGENTHPNKMLLPGESHSPGPNHKEATDTHKQRDPDK